jgi:hypothetical protein
MDQISYLIILRALFIFSLIEKGWSVRKCRTGKNKFEMYKSVKKNHC